MNKTKKVLLGENESVELDVDRLITTRLLVAAMSGGGKSFLLRRILEQTTGNFSTSSSTQRASFTPFATNTITFLRVRKAKGIARLNQNRPACWLTSLLELGVSAILDIYELPPRDRVLFVKNFLTSLVNAPKRLWHPALVVVDEAEHFAPQEVMRRVPAPS